MSHINLDRNLCKPPQNLGSFLIYLKHLYTKSLSVRLVITPSLAPWRNN